VSLGVRLARLEARIPQAAIPDDTSAAFLERLRSLAVEVGEFDAFAAAEAGLNDGPPWAQWSDMSPRQQESVRWLELFYVRNVIPRNMHD
jgi:hypothetical protein